MLTVTPVWIVLTWSMIGREDVRRRNGRQKEIGEIMREMIRMLNMTAKTWMLDCVSVNLFQAQTLQALRHSREVSRTITPQLHRMIIRMH
jgi:hypothetical protein